MKKILLIAAIAGVALASCSNDKHDEPEGDGSPGNPFIVNNAATLKKVGTGANGWGLGKHYLQTANISLSATETWTPIGQEDNFFGLYDGGGYSISNLTIPETTDIDAYGLFSAIGLQGAVRNVALIDVNINIHGDVFAGGIAGINRGIIDNCYVTGTVNGFIYIGGVVGVNIREIKNCYSTCNVTGFMGYGGIVGLNMGEVGVCYATGRIVGSDGGGGIVGGNSGTVDHCVALNKEVSVLGGYVGRVVGLNEIKDAYEGVMTNNLARAAGMTLKSGGVNITLAAGDKDAGNIHGADIAANYTHGANSVEFWSFGCDTRFWDLEENRLPHLKTTTGKAFNQQQNPEVL